MDGVAKSFGHHNFIPAGSTLSYGKAMLTEYIPAAMRQAHYEIMEDGRFWGDLPPCKGCWGDGDSLEECRENLRGALECWILVGVAHGDALPVIAAA
jgi:predicted RNase H-like HicB family nuclease